MKHPEFVEGDVTSFHSHLVLSGIFLSQLREGISLEAQNSSSDNH